MKNKELSPRQVRAIAALVETVTVEEASKVSRISRSRIFAWMREPTFREQLDAARMELFRSGLDRLKSITAEAVETLARVMRGKDPQAARLAAVSIVSFGFRGIEIGDLEKRMSEIEAALKLR